MSAAVTRIACAAAVTACAAGMLIAHDRQQAGQAPTPQRPVFRAGAYFVTVDATPLRNGQIVDGLTASDFQLFEDGRPQRIESFEYIRVSHTTPESELRDPNSRGEMLDRLADPRSRAFVVFLDKYHVTWKEARLVRDPLIHLLNTLFAPTDLYAAMTPDDEVHRLAFARKTIAFEEALKDVWTWGEWHPEDPETDAERALEQCYGNTGFRGYLPELYARRREAQVFASLEDLIMFLGSAREGRKTVFVFTDGWKLFERNDQMMAALARLGPVAGPPVGITSTGKLILGTKLEHATPYACDADANNLATLEHHARFRDLLHLAASANVAFFPISPAGLGISLERRGDLESLASETDGSAVVLTNDLRGALDRVQQQLAGYYLLGYSSTNTRFDGTVRRIKVATTMSGVTVRARRSYRAPTEAEMAAFRTPPASDSAADARDNAVTSALAPLARLRPGMTFFAYARVSGAELTVVAERVPGSSELTEGSLQVMVVGSGSDAGGSGRAALERGARSAIVRVPVRGQRGPWDVQVRLQAPSAQAQQDSVSVAAAAGPLLDDPLVFRAGGAGAGTPAAMFVFSRTERVRIEWPVRKALENRSVRLLDRAGQPLPAAITVAEAESAGRAVVAADLTLAALAPGDYVVEITASDGSATETRRLGIRVTR
jgi:VWFA-related protein